MGSTTPMKTISRATTDSFPVWKYMEVKKRLRSVMKRMTEIARMGRK